MTEDGFTAYQVGIESPENDDAFTEAVICFEFGLSNLIEEVRRAYPNIRITLQGLDD